MNIDKTTEIKRFVRFCIVGGMNTAITFLVFTLLRYMDVNIYVSNIASYIAGVINSFIWNRNWVYRSEGKKLIVEILLFLLFFGICYSIQLLVFKTALKFLPEWLSQLIGMGTYSTINFILNRVFTFKPKQ